MKTLFSIETAIMLFTKSLNYLGKKVISQKFNIPNRILFLHHWMDFNMYIKSLSYKIYVGFLSNAIDRILESFWFSIYYGCLNKLENNLQKMNYYGGKSRHEIMIVRCFHITSSAKTSYKFKHVKPPCSVLICRFS